MDEVISVMNNGYALLEPYPFLIALIVIGTFIILAKLVDYILSRTISRLVARTETSVDDHFISLLHRPIFSTVASIGLFIALDLIGLEQFLQNVAGAVIKTILIFVWLSFALQASKLLLTAMSGHKQRFEFVQPTTEPLLKNAVVVLLFLAGVYTIAFLCVMMLFAVGNRLLAVKRGRLPRETRASWPTAILAMIAVTLWSGGLRRYGAFGG